MKQSNNKKREFQEFQENEFETMFDDRSIVTERRLEQKESWFGRA